MSWRSFAWARPDDAVCEQLAAKFDALFPAQSKELNIHLANMLVYLQAPTAAAKTMALLGSALTQEEQIEYVLALRALKTGWTMPLREEYFRWFNTKGASYRGGNTFAGSLRTIKAEAVKTLTDDETHGAQTGSRGGARANLTRANACRPQAREGMDDERAGPAC